MIILLWLAAITSAIYCIKLEMDYRCEMKRRSLKIGNVFVYWEGVPKFQTELSVMNEHGAIVERIPFIPYYQAITHNREILEKCYKGTLQRHNRKQLQMIANKHDDAYFLGAPDPDAVDRLRQSIEAANSSSQVGGHDW